MQVSIIIDGEQFLISPARVEHLIEFLSIVRMQYESQARFIRSFSVNGSPLLHPVEEYLRHVWQHTQALTIEIDTISQTDHLRETVEDTYYYLIRLMYGISLCAEYYRLHVLEPAEHYWAYSIEGIAWVLEQLKCVEMSLQFRACPQLPAWGLSQAVRYANELRGVQDYAQVGDVLEKEVLGCLRLYHRFLEYMVRG